MANGGLAAAVADDEAAAADLDPAVLASAIDEHIRTAAQARLPTPTTTISRRK
jgi:hypothetical protein